MNVFKKRWCGLHSAIFPIYQFSFLKPAVWEATGGNNQLLTKAACGQAAGAISGRSLIRTHCIPPFSFPLYPAVFHTLTLIIPHCMYTFYIFFYTLILFHTTQAFIRTNSFLLYSIVYPPFLSMCSPCPKMPFV